MVRMIGENVTEKKYKNFSMNKQVRLSASTIKTYLNCSYLFYQSYIKLVPQKLHPSLPKGTLIHLILELLLLKVERHWLVHEIIKSNTVNISTSISRLIHKNLNKHGLDNSLVFKEVESCILVGLKQEYFGSNVEGKKLVEIKAEQQFSIPLGGYDITGTIDKIAIFEDKLIIYDYKSSKQKFSGEDREANVQAMLYLWAARQLFPGKKEYCFKFIFLRFPKNPIQEHVYNDTQIEGFSSWVAYIIKFMANMDEDAAYANFAADEKSKSWLCKAGATWRCPYMDAFEYYEVLDCLNNIVSTSIELPLNIDEDYQIVKKQYQGCARFIRVKQKEDIENFFENE